MKTLKYSGCLVAVGLFVAFGAVAAPLQKEQVAADAKWMLHLDADKLRSTAEGVNIAKQIDQAFALPKALVKSDTGSDLDLNKIHSITAYGNYSNQAAMLLKTDLEAERILDGVLARIEGEGKHEASPVGKTVEGGLTTYMLRDHLVVSLRPDKIVIASKSVEINLKANDVLNGKSLNLNSSDAFTGFPESPKSFFFLAAAQGFNTIEQPGLEITGGATNNPKAKILKMTDSGQITLGQDASQFFMNIALKAKTAEVVKQMQQVVQGMIALVALSQPDDSEMQPLTDSAKVTTTGNVVNLGLTLPADKVLLLLTKQMEKSAREHELRRATNAPATTIQK